MPVLRFYLLSHWRLIFSFACLFFSSPFPLFVALLDSLLSVLLLLLSPAFPYAGRFSSSSFFVRCSVSCLAGSFLILFFHFCCSSFFLCCSSLFLMFLSLLFVSSCASSLHPVFCLVSYFSLLLSFPLLRKKRLSLQCVLPIWNKITNDMLIGY